MHIKMVETDLPVKMSGTVLAMLHYENARSAGSPKNQVGFLLGEIVKYVTQKVTDSEREVVVTTRQVVINSLVACPMGIVFFDSAGRINQETLNDFLKDNGKRVIGWFRFRDIPMQKSLRDLNIHTQLSSYFSDKYDHSKDSFLWCLLTASRSESGGTHRFKHVFMKQKGRTFEKLAVDVANLNSNSSKQHGSEYKPTPLRNTPTESDAFSEIISSLNLDHSQNLGLDTLISIQNLAEKKIHDIIPDLCESDKEVARLEKEFCKLRIQMFKELYEKEREKRQNC